MRRTTTRGMVTGIFFMLVTGAIIYILVYAIVKGSKFKAIEIPCEKYGSVSIENIPAKCLSYFQNKIPERVYYDEYQTTFKLKTE